MANKKNHNFDLVWFKEYVQTYDGSCNTDNHTNETIVKDMLYGIGMALDSQKYQYNAGFKVFCKWLSNSFKDLFS